MSWYIRFESITWYCWFIDNRRLLIIWLTMSNLLRTNMVKCHYESIENGKIRWLKEMTFRSKHIQCPYMHIRYIFQSNSCKSPLNLVRNRILVEHFFNWNRLTTYLACCSSSMDKGRDIPREICCDSGFQRNMAERSVSATAVARYLVDCHCVGGTAVNEQTVSLQRKPWNRASALVRHARTSARGNVMRSIARSVAPSVIISWPYNDPADRVTWWQDRYSLRIVNEICVRRRSSDDEKRKLEAWPFVSLSIVSWANASFLQTDEISSFSSLFLSF